MTETKNKTEGKVENKPFAYQIGKYKINVKREFEKRGNFEFNFFYKDKLSWAEKSLINIAGSGRFAVDRAIKEYANNIWDLQVIK